MKQHLEGISTNPGSRHIPVDDRGRGPGLTWGQLHDVVSERHMGVDIADCSLNVIAEYIDFSRSTQGGSTFPWGRPF